jgi:hypothetical protein
MSSTWESRSLEEIATSSQNDRYDVLAFGSPLTADMPARAVPEQAPGSGREVQPAAQQNYTVGPDGKIHGGRASYGPSGLAPDGNGGGVIIQAPPAQTWDGQKYVTPQQGPYSGGLGSGGPEVPPGYNPNYYGPAGGWQPGGGNVTPDMPSRVPGTPGLNNANNPILDQRRADIIARSLSAQFNPDGYFGSGVIGGMLGATYIPWLMDKWNKNPDGLWRKYFSPTQATIDGNSEQGKVEREKMTDAVKNYRTFAREERSARQALKESTESVNGAYEAAKAEAERLSHLPPGDPQRSDVRIIAQNEKVKVLGAAEQPQNININELKTRVYTKPEDISAGKFLTEDDLTLLKGHRQNYDEELSAGARKAGERGTYKGARERLAGITAENDNLMNNPKAVKVGLFSGYTEAATGKVLGEKMMNGEIPPETPWYKRLGGQWNAVTTTPEGITKYDPWKAGGQGAIAAGAVLGADALGDWIFNGKNNYPNNAKIATSLAEGPVAGAFLILGSNPATKIGGAVGSVLAAKGIDAAFGGTNDATYSELLKPNAWEAGLVGAAWMLPFRNPTARVAAVTTGWLLGKGANLAKMWGVPVPGVGDAAPGAKMWDDVSSSMGNFKSSPSYDGFKHLVDSSTKLAMENEGAIGARITLFTNDSAADRSPAKYETLAGLYAGMGNMWLSRGSKLDPNDPKSHNDQGRILPKAEYDLGGDAASLFTSARDNLGMAANYAKGAGSRSDLDRISQEQKAVQGQLDRIYGSHQMGSIYDRLLTDLRSKVGTTESQFSIDQLTRFEINLKNKAMNPGGDEVAAKDPAYRAKLCRDVALVDLAVAQFSNEHNNGERSKQYYAQAVQFLRMSMQFDRNSSDAQQLQQIADKVGGGVRPAIDNQYNSTWNNPFGIQTPRN